jgi:hypothetical protein
MWCIHCNLLTCPIVLTTDMDINKVEVEVLLNNIITIIIFIENVYLAIQ